MSARPTGYVLAGGRSSRMGEDKARLRLCGQTLLELATTKLWPACDEVVVIGERIEVPPGMRVLRDRLEGCGPLGGIEAALSDRVDGLAVFLPVDMPLLPAGLVAAQVKEWTGLAVSGARVILPTANGRSQPLFSMLHRSILPDVALALREGRYKVRPVLEGAAARLAAEVELPLQQLLLRPEIGDIHSPHLTDEDRRLQPHWFRNVNTPEEFAEVRQLLGETKGGHVAVRE